MDDAAERLQDALQAMRRLLWEAQRTRADLCRAAEQSRALIEQSATRIDRREERAARLPARHVPHVSLETFERDRVRLAAESEEALERTMVREIERRVAEGWAVAGITYLPEEAGRVAVAIDLQRARPEAPAPSPID